MTPFLPGYEPGTWVEIVSGPEMLCSLQYDYGTTFTLPATLPNEPKNRISTPSITFDDLLQGV